MDKHKIITISRQYGSGGRIVGKLLAERLGMPFAITRSFPLAAEKTGLSKECLCPFRGNLYRKSAPFT